MSEEQKPIMPRAREPAVATNSSSRLARYSMAGVALIAAIALLLGVYSLTDKESGIVPDEPTMTRDIQDPVIAARAAQIISTFENSTTEVQYGYAEDIGDGRGITAGRAGFCTGSECGGDLLMVIEQYTQVKPQNDLAIYIPALESARGSDTNAGLENFPRDWEKSAQDPAMRAAQDKVFNDIYRDPALNYARQAGISSAAGQLVILDTIIQHGGGTDPDGLPALLNRTVDQYGTATGREKQWLNEFFLEARRQVLLNTQNTATAEGWRDSVDRVNALQSIVTADLSLMGPLEWSVYGDRFNLPEA